MTDTPGFGFIHRFVPASRAGLAPLLLLHGTGGNENDLLPLGRQLSPGAALLSPRGKVLEHGMPRFFRRRGEGVFDLPDMTRRAHELADFVDEARKAYGIAAPIAIGYSNGANVAYATMLAKPDALAGAVLLRATMPFEPPPSPPDLHGAPVLLLSGAHDPLSPPRARERLAGYLAEAGAQVTHQTLPSGHNLSPDDFAFAKSWLDMHQPA